jgi:iron complex outermembrane receptor protein
MNPVARDRSARPAFATVVVAVASGALVPTPATAQSGSPTLQTLPAVEVTDRRERETAASPVPGYAARRATTATKTDTPLRETPQAITVVPRDQLQDQGATGVQEALGYAAGVRGDAYGVDSRTDSVIIRGNYPDEYLDGLRKNFDYYTSNARTDPYTLERIEVLRGPSAMLFGQSSTASGLVNLVSKRPLAEAQREFGLQVGSFNRRQLQADLTGPLTDDGRLLYRLVAVARDADTQVDFVRDDRRLVAPSLTWKPTAATTWTFQGLYQRDRTGSTSQFFPWEGMLTANRNGILPTRRFIGEPGFDRYDTDRTTAGWMLEHRLGDDWTVRQNLRYARNEVDYTGFYGDSFTLPGGWAGDPGNRRLFGRFYSSDVSKVGLVTADQSVEGRIAAGGIEHRVLVGLDYSRYRLRKRSAFDGPLYAGGGQPLIDAYAPTYGQPFPAPAADALPLNTQRQLGVYAQDQMKIARNWIVLAGLRRDEVDNALAGSRTEESSATTKRFAFMYAADNGWSPYLSYSESFTPVAGFDARDARFTPQRGKQWELGVKYLPVDQPTVFTAALYDLRERDRLAPDPAGGPDSVQVGRTKTTGAEFEVRTSVSRRLDVIAFYNYARVDEQLTQVPRHQFGLWGKARFGPDLPGLSAGAGVRWMSAFNDGIAPETPGVALFDAMLAYDVRQWRFALNVNNLTDRVYNSVCLARGDCWWGARRNAIASVSYRF